MGGKEKRFWLNIKWKYLKKIKKKINRNTFINLLASFLGVDLYLLSLNKMGILNWRNWEISGEKFLIEKVLLKEMNKISNPIIFDVGANVGSYSFEISKKFQTGLIYSFEPLPVAYDKAKNRNKSNKNVFMHNIGFSSSKGFTTIHTYKSETDSELASFYRDVLTDIHKESSPISIEVAIDTIDDFCENKKIDTINFLKIDTEGHEFSIIQGASRYLKEKKIDFIQFEFNEMNVVSRVFFKDFFDLLTSYQYKIYRLHETFIEPIEVYNTNYEIFKFQNFFATYKDISLISDV